MNAYIKISRTYAPGEQVANLWKDIYVDHNLESAKWTMNYAKTHNYSDWIKTFNKAIQEDFGLTVPSTPEQAADIKLTIKEARESCINYKRRSQFSERFKDMLQFLGLATLLGGLGYMAVKAIEKLR